MLEGLKAALSRFSARSHVSGLVLAALASLIMFWQLGGWTPGLSPAESSAAATSQSLHSIMANPIDGPQHILQYGLQSANWHGHYGLRFASALLGVVFILAFYSVTRAWFGKQSALFGSLILLSTPWLIIAGRQASSEVLLLTPILLIAAYVWFSRTKQRRWAWLAFCASIGLSLYVPGMIWLILIGLVILRLPLRSASQPLSKKLRLGGLALILIIATPLIISIVKEWQLLKPLMLIPQHFASVGQIVRDILWSAAALFWRTAHHFDLTIGRWPMLSAVQVILFVFGSYAMWDKTRRLFYGLMVVVGFSVIAAGLNQQPTLLLLGLAALGLVMTAGLRYLYLEWRTIFPRNPIPQTFALILIGGLVLGQLWFGVRYALVAWPHTTATKTVYMLK